MISDEIESLRKRGMADEDIAALIRKSSSLEVTAGEIAEYYPLQKSAINTADDPPPVWKHCAL